MTIKRLGWLALGCLVALPLGAAGETGRVGETTLEAARAELRARAGAYDRVHARYETLREAGRLSREELEDYAAYLLGLERLVDEQRRVVARLDGSEARDGNGAAGAQPRLGEDFSAGRTESEQVSSLDRRLGDSLSEFDEMLLREQQELAAKTRPSDSGAEDATGEGREGGAEEGDGGGQGEGGASGERGEDAAGAPAEGVAGESSEGQPGSRDRAQGGAEGGESESGGERPGGRRVADARGAEDRAGGAGGSDAAPSDIPGGGDDDVVARQLREAAESEQDPELREKLWEEYRRYKSRGQ